MDRLAVIEERLAHLIRANEDLSDIVTGQGHGGSGLRFFARDYIDDFVHQTFPRVTVERDPTPGPGK